MKTILNIPKPANKSWVVKGKNIEELFKNLNKHKWWGRYRAYPSYSFKEKGGVVNEFTLKSKPEIIMPKWSNYTKASKAEKKSWDDMYKALMKHESNHHDIFQKEATAWQKAMDKVVDLNKKNALREWEKFDKATQNKQDAYDAKSDHGKKEGVILNLP